MGVSSLPDFFQQKMNNLLQGFEFILTYMDKILILIEEYWTYHDQNLELNLNILKESGLQCSIENYCFGKTEMVYLYF